MSKAFKSDEPRPSVVVPHINAYLIPGPDIYVASRSTSFFNVPEMSWGNKPTDGGYLSLSPTECDELVAKEPRAAKWIRPFLGAREFIQGKKRYCLWLVDCPPDELRKMPLVYERVKAVREFRLASKKAATRRDADKPTLFQEIRQPKDDYILVPCVSSERRRYIPMGYVSSEVICGASNQMLPNADLFHFGVLTSSVHMNWVRLVCGRLKSDYRYSATICYNPYPWPLFYSEEQRRRIEATAAKILEARANYPEATYADLYDEVSMPYDLRAAHKKNDLAVAAAYGFEDILENEPLAGSFSA